MPVGDKRWLSNGHPYNLTLETQVIEEAKSRLHQEFGGAKGLESQQEVESALRRVILAHMQQCCIHWF